MKLYAKLFINYFPLEYILNATVDTAKLIEVYYE